jgi:hypothetical protein
MDYDDDYDDDGYYNYDYVFLDGLDVLILLLIAPDWTGWPLNTLTDLIYVQLAENALSETTTTFGLCG